MVSPDSAPDSADSRKEPWYKIAHPIIAIIVGLIVIFGFITGVKSCRDLADKKLTSPPMIQTEVEPVKTSPVNSTPAEVLPEPEINDKFSPSTLTPTEVSHKVEKSIEEEDFNSALFYVKYLRTEEERDGVRNRIFDKLIKSQKLDEAKKVINQFELQYNKDKAKNELEKEYLKK